ncbi:hypothetical protein JAAARDRAFT_37455 [Jaapia argillacea MUCL 33604]|uniref:Uncharacterized protein n=1 Tax=Jaapia argillacea MUCL 33604 TaxID=933084 RepID=A0A067PYN5_9AGAM|nr:hypothetical protein JAAARDRAFT_37455 [Jaapia argillacea MUCL 33604]
MSTETTGSPGATIQYSFSGASLIVACTTYLANRGFIKPKFVLCSRVASYVKWNDWS